VITIPTVAFHTLGCKVNQYETEAIWRLFEEAGYKRVEFSTFADVYVINTCTVTNTGDQKSRQIIRRAIRQNSEAVIVVTGCYAQTSANDILNIPGVDIVIGNMGREKIIDLVNQYLKERTPINAVSDIMKTREFEELPIQGFAEKTRAFLKIQEGCNNFCTFCIIPWARGLLRSRKPENVLTQAKELLNAGYKEIVLTGIHTGGYGEDLSDYNLAQLLSDLEEITGLKRIRISSIEASQITDEILQILKRSQKIVDHLHIPLQAGDDQILKLMRRKYTTKEYKEKITAIRAVIPHIAITTDVIVGFPGETEEHFANSYQFIQELAFSALHVFPYSKRSGTPAANMPGQVKSEEKEERVKRLINLSNQLAQQYAQQFSHKIVEVIPEQPYKKEVAKEWLTGYSSNYLHVVFPGTEEMIGNIYRVRITEVENAVCYGQIVPN